MDPFLCRKNFKYIFTFKIDDLLCKSPGFLQHFSSEFHSLQLIHKISTQGAREPVRGLLPKGSRTETVPVLGWLLTCRNSQWLSFQLLQMWLQPQALWGAGSSEVRAEPGGSSGSSYPQKTRTLRSHNNSSSQPSSWGKATLCSRCHTGAASPAAALIKSSNHRA